MRRILSIPYGNSQIVIEIGDITESDAEAIVNAANSSLMGGGGVDGAIHAAAGPEMDQELARIRMERYADGLPAGKAVMTRGYRLRSKYVIHTVGPIWRGGHDNEDETLASAYRNSLELSAENGIHDVAFPAISTGIYGFPFDRAERIALETVLSFLREKKEGYVIRFVFYTEKNAQEFLRILKEYGIYRGNE
ncbi:O-acetyl-ADP-ribose deacetylase [Thermoplasma sp. Kam2015]|uniref:O-acetyl-ADP-ribose deacetylase n=1 Tax=Thermoplasma sp. Kam2015 TaxID=2094122 RepID=UPI000D8176E5|nr:O-acetyl-ADP-ribose deacetylase [Thermoplasma sp. Kam2015]PYB67954.1 O-acetyl-ADP-ribose deacetylase [Thermoplasma sp. Kam2015]